MTKAELDNEIAKRTGIRKDEVLKTVETMMDVVKDSLADGENVYLKALVALL